MLNYFLTVAREENFTRAAQMLHVTQSTLSRQIAQLEGEPGVELSTRSNHNIILTESGMILKHRTQEMLPMAEKTRQEPLQRDKEFTGKISIGSGEFQITRLLAQIISPSSEKHPLVQCEIHSGNAENVHGHIERGLLDIGLMAEPIDIRKYDSASMPVKERWGAQVCADSGLAQGEGIEPEDLIRRQLIITKGGSMKSSIGKWFGDLNTQVKIIATSNPLYNEAMLVENHLDTVLGTKLNCMFEYLHFIFLYSSLEGSIVLAWKKEQVSFPVANSFIKLLRQYEKVISDGKIQALDITT